MAAGGLELGARAQSLRQWLEGYSSLNELSTGVHRGLDVCDQRGVAVLSSCALKER